MGKLIFGLLFLTLIVIDAIGEGCRDRKLKIIAGFLESILLFILLGSMLFFQTLYWPLILWPDQCILLILAYTSIRYALFDIVYNITIGSPYIFGISRTKTFDIIHKKIIKWLGKLFDLPKNLLLLWIRAFALILGILLIKWSF